MKYEKRNKMFQTIFDERRRDGKAMTGWVGKSDVVTATVMAAAQWDTTTTTDT